jgi:hypothetical protein
MNKFEPFWELRALATMLSIIGLLGIYLRYRNHHRRQREIPDKTPTTKQSLNRLDQLRNDLLLKVLGDQAKVRRLIAFERQKTPTNSEAELVQAAIDRWERDNR